MGSSLGNVTTPQLSDSHTPEKPNDEKQQRSKEKEKQVDYDVDVIEAANIALAIKHREHITNLELSLSISSLPPVKAFEEMHAMIVLFKHIQGENVELGRTEIISANHSPKFLTSFILPSSSEKQDEIEFKVYNCKKLNQDRLEDQILIGIASHKLQSLNDNETSQLTLTLTDPAAKQKSVLKVSCCEYDGGNLKYQVKLQASKFTGKGTMYFIIEVSRDNEWIPVARSNPTDVKPKVNFEALKVAANKFPAQENTCLRFRFYEKDTHEELGSTEELVLQTLLTPAGQTQQEEKAASHRVYKNGFLAGYATILKWVRVNRDSFLTYIVNGARLHLILGIDFTNSNFQGETVLHHPDDAKNPYIAAIREIVGTLQYFDYYNQIAVYGFGAKLPPYYKCVGHCFALNGNYFHPLITGGVDQIVRLYRQTLQKVQPHGPTKLSEIVNMAIQFAQADYQSSNYYVLIVITDGSVDDYQLTIDKMVEASAQPLSIVLVGVGDGDFTELKKMDQDGVPLCSERTGKVVERDMIDFINIKTYIEAERNAMTETKLARKTFSEIPRHFVDYMQKKGIKPNKEKRSLKAAKSEFITEKIKEGKNLPIIPQVQFLKDQKKKMRKDLIALGFATDQSLDRTLNMPLNDLNYFIELHASTRPPRPPQIEPAIEVVAARQEKRFQEHLQKNEEFLNRRIQNQLLKREMNQAGRRKKMAQKAVQVAHKQKPKLIHPCLQCGQNQICMLYLQCGHLALCEGCCSNICILCKEYNQAFININDYDHQP